MNQLRDRRILCVNALSYYCCQSCAVHATKILSIRGLYTLTVLNCSADTSTHWAVSLIVFDRVLSALSLSHYYFKSKLHYCDSLWICCATDRQQIAVMEFGLANVMNGCNALSVSFRLRASFFATSASHICNAPYAQTSSGTSQFATFLFDSFLIYMKFFGESALYKCTVLNNTGNNLIIIILPKCAIYPKSNILPNAKWLSFKAYLGMS